MTTWDRGQRRSGTGVVIVIFVGVLFVGLIILKMGLRPVDPFPRGPGVNELDNLTLSQHALDRHQEDAVRAYEWAKAHGNSSHRYDCDDGRHRWFVPIGWTGRWALVVIEAGEILTAFTTDDRNYVDACKNGGKAFWNMAHP